MAEEEISSPLRVPDLGSRRTGGGPGEDPRSPAQAKIRDRSSILLVSLGNRALSVGGIEKIISAAAKEGASLTLYLLDSAERINQRVLNSLDDSVAADRVEERCLKLITGLALTRDRHVDIRRLSAALSDPRYDFWLAALKREAQNNSHFAHQCENQVYVNLQPKLRRLGAKNKRHPIVTRLTDYLLEEFALKLFLLETEPYDIEFGIGNEMQIWQAIARGDFAELPAQRTIPEFRAVEIPPPQGGGLALEGVSFSYQGLDHHESSTPRIWRWTPGRQSRASHIISRTPVATLGLTHVTWSFEGSAAILGPSGSYKTTLLKLIAGHLFPKDGAIRVAKRDVTALAPEKRHVATVFQDFALFPHLSGLENVLEAGRRLHQYSASQRTWLAHMHLRRLGVSHCADRLPTTMSGGEQQRVAIGRALMSEPEVLLLDEPTAALDSLQREALVKLLKQLSETSPALATLIVSHDREFVLDVVDQLAVMDGGQIIAAGDKSSLMMTPPSWRVAEILGTHSAIPGELREGAFIADCDISFTIQINNPPRPLIGHRCIALVRRDAVTVEPLRDEDISETGEARGMLVEVNDRGSSLRIVVRLSNTCALTSVSKKTPVLEGLQLHEIVAFRCDPGAITIVPD